jgi:hypothetical protein
VKRWRPSEEQAELYIRGGCPWLAIALHEETGWPLAMLVGGPSDEWRHGEVLPTIAHVFVLTPRGTLLDILGERTIKDLKRHYHDLIEPRVQTVNRKDLEYLMADDMPLEACDVRDFREARRVAKLIVGRLKRSSRKN